MSAGGSDGPDDQSRFTEDEIDELIRDVLGTVEPDRFDELVAVAVTSPPSTLAPVTPARRGSARSGASLSSRTRWLAVAAAVAVVVGGSIVVVTSGGGGDPVASPPADRSTTSAVEPTSTAPGPPPPSSLPADFLDRLGRSGATADELVCVQQRSSVSGAYGCLSLDTVVRLQESYLRDETDATEAQIDCVLGAVRALGVDDARTVSDPTVATQVYGSCGVAG